MKKKRDVEIDALKGLACITVVLIHVFRGKGLVETFVGEFGRWAVPAFFMVQGIYMKNSAGKPWLESAIGKIKKIYLPFLIYSVAYGAYFYFYDGKWFDFSDVLLGKTAVHLYYVVHYMIFALTLPFVYKLPKRHMHMFLWFMVISNFAICTSLEIQRFYGVRLIKYSGINPLKWWGFVAVGMLSTEYPNVIKEIKNNKTASIAVSASMAAFGTFVPYWSGRLGYMYNRASLFPLAIGITMLIIVLFQYEKMPGKEFLVYISSRSFGIYLMHFFVVHALKYIIGVESLWIVAIFTMAISLFIIDFRKIFKSRATGNKLNKI